MKKLTTEEFIIMAKLIHGNKFDYSKVEYINAKSKIKIICDKGHTFEQSPDGHLSGRECMLCKNINVERLNTTSFINRCNDIHRNKYDYSKFVYVDRLSISTIICKNHGEFKQMAREHLKGSGCRFCYYDSLRTSVEEFIISSNKLHNNKYDYSKVKFNLLKEHIVIICPEHGEFIQTAISHLSEFGCFECTKQRITKSNEDFISDCIDKHGEEYDYSKTKYIGSHKQIIVTCKEHGDFKIRATSHLSGRGCKYCRPSKSKMEIEWITSFGNNKLLLDQSILINGREIKPDAIDPDNKIIYEFYGDFWHGNPQVYNSDKLNKVTKSTMGELYNNTVEREIFLKLHGYAIISMWENDYKNK